MKKVLIVEDEKELADVMGSMLTSAGYESSYANDGDVAIQKLSAEMFDLAILDILMPNKDGFYVLSEVKKLGIKTPIIVASNLGQEEYMTKAKNLGAVDYFIKSDISLNDLINKIQVHIH